MAMKKQQQQVVVAVALLLLVASAGCASAASCSVGQLAVCAPAIESGSKPSSGCCSNLKAQQSCFCQYIKNPSLGRYVNSPNARKTLTSCGITPPRC
nr:unnamed protein product [Digitaria exilis]